MTLPFQHQHRQEIFQPESGNVNSNYQHISIQHPECLAKAASAATSPKVLVGNSIEQQHHRGLLAGGNISIIIIIEVPVGMKFTTLSSAILKAVAHQ
jgi:hypothetical protein